MYCTALRLRRSAIDATRFYFAKRDVIADPSSSHSPILLVRHPSTTIVIVKSFYPTYPNPILPHLTQRYVAATIPSAILLQIQLRHLALSPSPRAVLSSKSSPRRFTTTNVSPPSKRKNPSKSWTTGNRFHILPFLPRPSNQPNSHPTFPLLQCMAKVHLHDLLPAFASPLPKRSSPALAACNIHSARN